MISYLRGTVAEHSLETVVLDVAGVGYGVRVSNETFGRLQTGKEVQLIIFEHIKEDAHDLYGFLDQPAKSLFELLLSVNGVGAKMALSVMNIGSQSDLQLAIANGDITYIQTANGVGKRLAERLVVDLKDKVGLSTSEEAVSFLTSPLATDEAVQALSALGFTAQDAATALSGIDDSLDTEERIKQALQNRRAQ